MFKALFRSISICIVILSFNGCYDIDDNRRVFVQGNLVNAAGTPIENIVVEAKGGSTVLGYTTSGENGAFSFTSLESTTQDFSIYINPKAIGDTLYASPIFINEDVISSLGKNRRSQKLYELGEILLPQLAILEIRVSQFRISDTLNYRLNFNESICENFLVDEKIDTLDSRCFVETITTGSVVQSENDFIREVSTLKNTTAVLSYNINGGDTQTVNIPIDQYRTSYVLDL